MGNTCFVAAVVRAVHAAEPLRRAVVEGQTRRAMAEGEEDPVLDTVTKLGLVITNKRGRTGVSRWAYVAPEMVSLLDQLWRLGAGLLLLRPCRARDSCF